MKWRASERGLSLIEMVVGMGIAVGLIALIIQSYTVTMRMSKTGIQRVEQLEEAQLVLDQITRDLHSAVAVSGADGNIQFQLIGNDTTEKQKKFMRFVRVSSSSDTTGSKLEEIMYPLGKVNRINRAIVIGTEQPETEGTVKTKKGKPSLNPAKPADTSIESHQLGFGLENTSYVLSAKCLDMDNSTSGNVWVSDWTERKSLPKLIQVTLELENESIARSPIQTQLTRTIQVGGL